MYYAQTDDISGLMKSISDFHRDKGVLITKNARNNRNTYADLVGILDTLQERLKKYDIKIIQPPSSDENGKNIQLTIVYHLPTGQWIRGAAIFKNKPIPDLPNNCDAEMYGMYLKAIANYNLNTEWAMSTTTYRRYCAMMSLGLFATDDPTDNDDHNTPKVTVELLRGELVTLIGNDKELEASILKRCRINNIGEMVLGQAEKAIEVVRSKKAKVV